MHWESGGHRIVTTTTRETEHSGRRGQWRLVDDRDGCGRDGVDHELRALRKLQRRERLRVVAFMRAHGRDDGRASATTERVAEEKGELGVAVGYVAWACTRERVDHVPQRREALVDRARLLEPHARRVCGLLALRSGEIDEMQRGEPLAHETIGAAELSGEAHAEDGVRARLCRDRARRAHSPVRSTQGKQTLRVRQPLERRASEIRNSEVRC